MSIRPHVGTSAPRLFDYAQVLEACGFDDTDTGRAGFIARLCADIDREDAEDMCSVAMVRALCKSLGCGDSSKAPVFAALATVPAFTLAQLFGPLMQFAWD